VSRISLRWKFALCTCALAPILFVGGCSQTPRPAITISPNIVTFAALTQGSTSSATPVTVTNSGTGDIIISSVAIGGSNPTDFTNANGCNSAALKPTGSCTISVTFAPLATASGPLSETITLTDNAPGSPQMITVSGTANPISLNLTPSASAIATSGTVAFSAVGDPAGVTWSLIGAPFRTSPGIVASPGTLTPNGSSANYVGPGGPQGLYATVTATSVTNPAISAFASINVVGAGAFTATNNVQVAQYTVTPPSPANVSVQFGPTVAYGLNTWSVPTPQILGSSVSLYVAGMKQSSPYHMSGVIQFNDGSVFNGPDFTFTTGALPAGTVPNITATTTAGMTPQPGVEVLDLLQLVPTTPALLEVAVADLSGNIIWAYSPGASVPSGTTPQPVKLLPNGHFLIDFVTANSVGEAQSSVLQEVDLGSNVIWQMTAAQLNTALAAAPASCTECNVTILSLHHDIAILPNGHLVVLADTNQVVSGATVYGDVVIDLGDMENVGGGNPNHVPQPAWAWNEFNHLDINRRPYSYPDWTHTNAVLYSKDDGNLIISIRHQNWLVKIDYNNGAGMGDILWKLGAVLSTDTTPEDTANFTLLKADGTPDTTATDWFFAQHGPSFTTTNTTGQFGLVLFDNGDDRGVVDVAGGTCGVTGQPACYSTVPLFTINETAMTATLAFNPTTPNYSYFGGNAEVLANGNVEYDECNDTSPASEDGVAFEVTQTGSPQTVWSLAVTGQDIYRAMRMPSLYPGVQW
jgi:arylsulfate sulfotransferase